MIIEEHLSKCLRTIRTDEQKSQRHQMFHPISKVKIVKTEGPFTYTVSVPVSIIITVNVYHSVNGDGPIGFGTYFVSQCKFDSDRDGSRDGTCKWTLNTWKQRIQTYFVAYIIIVYLATVNLTMNFFNFLTPYKSEIP